MHSPPRRQLIVATNNPDKLAEIKAILGPANLSILSASDFPDFPRIEEIGLTLEENASLKAKGVWEKYQIPTLADDTGLEVECLGGRPGVFSSRYAGPGASYDDNCRRLLAEIAATGSADRRARFRCVVAFVAGDGRLHLAEGVLEGMITNAKWGAAGFGYDPIFYVPTHGKTLAEMSPEEKNKISHRQRALMKILPIVIHEMAR